MSALLKPLLRMLLDILVLIAGLPFVAAGCLRNALSPRRPADGLPRLVWQSTPIKSLAYMARSMAARGHVSETAVTELYAINRREDFDHLLFPAVSRGKLADYLCSRWMAYRFFGNSLSRYDVFFMYFDGGVLRDTLLAPLELKLLRLAGKKIVVMPYGSDAFVYDQMSDPLWRHGLMMSYPAMGNHAERVQRRIRRMTHDADVVVGCLVHFTSLPRWDILPLTCYPVDTDRIRPFAPPATSGPIRIAHAANHRGVKGTEFLVRAVQTLRAEGLDIDLDLIERVPNHEALERIGRADIYVDQLVMGYALAALEGLALGRVVVSPVDGLQATDLFRTYSYLDECPIVSAGQRTIERVLRDLIARRAEWPQISARSRAYVEKRHSFDASADMFSAILDRTWFGKPVDLINFYHPLLERAKDDGPATP